jgi:dUTP pyrophosphatase
MTVQVGILREPDALDLPLPEYATAGAAGLDLRAAVEGDLTLAPGERALVSTGLRLLLPEGYEGQVRPRSGLAWHHGLTLLNAPGTIDCDYRGVVKVVLVNLGQEAVAVQRGDRIAQLVVAPVSRMIWTEAAEAFAAEPGRGEGGFGSTGK